MTKRTTTRNPPCDPAQFSLGEIVANLPAVRRAKQVNTMSHVDRRLTEPLESNQDSEARLSFQHTAFVTRACAPAMQRGLGALSLGIEGERAAGAFF